MSKSAERSPLNVTPDIAGDAGMVEALAGHLASIQQRRRVARVRQVAWGVGDSACAMPGTTDALTFGELWAMLDAEEGRLASEFAELMPAIVKLSAGGDAGGREE